MRTTPAIETLPARKTAKVNYLVLAAVCLFMLVRPGLSSAKGMTTVDPNTLQARSSEPVGAVSGRDDRLSQKVTYQVRQGRLQDIATDLSRITGVTISSGKNTGDWRVRDIPVTVSAKDIELGKLLSTIADAGHVALTSSKMVDKPRKYQFVRTIKMENALAQYEAAQNVRKRQRFDMEWSAVQSLASRPEDVGDDVKSMQFNTARATGRLVSALGNSARDSLKAGEQVVLQGDGLPDNVRLAMLELVTAMRKSHESGASFPGSHHPNSKSTQQDIEQAEVILYTHEQSDSIWPQMCVNTPAHDQRGGFCMDSLQVGIRGALEYVKMPKETEPLPDPLGGRDIKTKYTLVEWDKPIQECLATKVKLKAPEKLDGFPTIADVILALSEESGYTIVCEDFDSQRLGSRVSSFPQGEMKVQDVLRLFRWDVEWLTDADNKLIVAVSRSWIDKHEALVPVSLIRQLKSKLEKGGVNLDDATPLTTLTDAQNYGWISGSRDLSSLTMASFGPMKPLWALYDSLSPEEKLAAKSESGIPMSFFPPAQLAAACKKCNAALTNNDHDRASRDKRSLPTDLKVLSALKMRITSRENWVELKIETSGGGGISWSGGTTAVSQGDTKPPSEGMLRKTTYVMEIFGNSGDKTYLISNDGPNGFPYFPLKWAKGENGPQGTPVK